MSGLSVHALIRRVDLLTLRLFLAAIEERQLGRAAQLENIAPSAATKRIQDLEDIAGVRLLERNPKGVAPSKAGLVLARRLQVIFANLEDLRRELAEFTEGVRGHVRVAATGAIIVQHLAREIGDFTRNFPFIEVEIQEEDNPAVLRALKAGEVDVALYVHAEGLDYEALATTPYRSDRLVVVFPKGHRFGEMGAVTLADILDETFIAIRPGTTLMTQIRAAARAMGRELRPRFNVNGINAARSLAQEGLGVTVQPECMLSIEDFERVSVTRIAEPWAVRRMHVATQRGVPVSPAARLLIEQLTAQPAGEEAP